MGYTRILAGGPLMLPSYIKSIEGHKFCAVRTVKNIHNYKTLNPQQFGVSFPYGELKEHLHNLKQRMLKS